jgi:hypothetical protein
MKSVIKLLNSLKEKNLRSGLTNIHLDSVKILIVPNILLSS